MANRLWERLRGARRIELFAALALAALLALALIGSGGGDPPLEKTELELRVEGILSTLDGVGEVSAMITQEADGSVRGALIVAKDLEDMGVYLRLQRAVAALLEVEADRIEIIGRSGSFGGTI